MKTYFVDSFTTEAFRGNPAGVCILDGDIEDSRMQNIAKEIGFSETAFVRRSNVDDTYGIRFFSPKKEIPLCGHATLASAKIIFETTTANEINFLTGGNVALPIRKDQGRIVMEFPVYNTTPEAVPDAMLVALGITRVTNVCYSAQNKIILIEIDDAEALKTLSPDFNALGKSYENINGVLVTAPSNTAGFDFHYRYFWPWAGTNEDPVTGGVQTFLAKYWADKLNKSRLNAFQSSERTGFMTVELRNDKVFIYGDAVIVLEGQLR